jgi:hypothetical protein
LFFIEDVLGLSSPLRLANLLFNICPFILPKRLISKFDLAGFFFVFFFASFFSSFFFAKPVVDLYTIFDLLEVIVAI